MDKKQIEELKAICNAIRRGGLEPYDQLYGYVTSGKTEYITRTDNARERIQRLDSALVREYLRRMEKDHGKKIHQGE